VWGFLKYFHPAMCCNTNWDDKLIEVLQQLDTAQAGDNLDAEVEYLLRAAHHTTIATTATLKPSQSYTSFDREPYGSTRASIAMDFSWMSNPFISVHLQGQLQYFTTIKTPFENYYLQLRSDSLSRVPTFANERLEPDSLLNTYQRVLGLARLWNFVEYFYPYKHLLDEPWDSVLVKFIPTFIAATTDGQYTEAVLRLRTRLHDTHTVVRSSGSSSFFGTYYVPVPLTYIEGKVVIEQSSQQVGVQRGDILISLNGLSVDSLVYNLGQYLGASNESVKYHIVASNLLRYSKVSTATLELLSTGGIKRVVVQCAPPNKYKYDALKPKPTVHVIDGIEKLLYIDFTRITQQQIYPTLDTLMQHRGVVFDLRGYPDWILYPIMNQLADPTPFVFIHSPNYRFPGFASEYVVSCGLKRRYMGKVVVLVNEQTISRAEFTAMALQTIPGMKTVGSQTAGTDGDVRRINLPGGVTMMITGNGIYYPNKENTQRIGVHIDVVAKPTIAGIRAERDEVLEKGIEVLQGLIKKDTPTATQRPLKKK
jgi:carboxyl-terminal processing protease